MDREQFEANPDLFIEKAIKEYVANSPSNRLRVFNDDPIFDEPLVGYADGDDTIFQDYKTIIGDFHFTPREALVKHLKRKFTGAENRLTTVTVISFVLPLSLETRLSNRKETNVPSLRWNHTRWYGQDFIFKLSRYVVSLLEELGHEAIDPERARFFEIKHLDNGLSSTWSQRHIAYAAGLGTFSLNDGFITPRGIAVRFGSVVTDLALSPSARVYENHLANCLFYRDGSCNRCIDRCPVEALSEQGHDKKNCRDCLYSRGDFLKEMGREGYIGYYDGCGLCQTKVPCESRIPPGKVK